jgi:hypothetical protein
VTPRLVCPSWRWMTISGTPWRAISTACAVAQLVGGEGAAHAGLRSDVSELGAHGGVDHARPRVGPVTMQNSAPTGSSARYRATVGVVPRPTRPCRPRVGGGPCLAAPIATPGGCSRGGADGFSMQRCGQPRPATNRRLPQTGRFSLAVQRGRRRAARRVRRSGLRVRGRSREGTCSRPSPWSVRNWVGAAGGALWARGSGVRRRPRRPRSMDSSSASAV